MREQTVETYGLRMRWEESGTGRPVVLLHGIPTSPRLWRHVVPALSGCRALAWEMVGYGRSVLEGIGRDLSLARQAEYLIQWMDEIDVQQAVLVGHDLGGGVAQIAASRYPERVRGLVLVNAVCYDSWPIPSVKILRALGPLLGRSPDALIYVILAVLCLRGHDQIDRMKESLRTHWSPYAATDASAALERQIRWLDVRDTLAVEDALTHLQIPASVVWGAADPLLKLRFGERLARDLRAPIDRIPGGKHYVPEDHPDRIVAAVERVLARL